MIHALSIVLEAAAVGLFTTGTVFAVWVVNYCFRDTAHEDTVTQMDAAGRSALRVSKAAGAVAAVLCAVIRACGAA